MCTSFQGNPIRSENVIDLSKINEKGIFSGKSNTVRKWKRVFVSFCLHPTEDEEPLVAIVKRKS